MSRRIRRAAVAAPLLALAAGTLATGTAQAAPAIRITDLGSLGGSSGVASAINTRGQVTGSSDTADGSTHAFLWQDGRLRDLGTLGGANSYGNAINERGHVVGISDTAGGDRHGFLWRDGRMTDLGTLPGGRNSNAWLIAAGDQVAGQAASNGDEDYRAVVWRRGAIRELVRPGWFGIDATAGNESGQIAGSGATTVDGAQVTRAYLWQRDRFTDLGSLVPGGFSQAADVNELGQVAGLAGDADGTPTPYVWRNGRMTALGSLGGGGGQAYAIGDTGSVVGSSTTASGEQHAFLWRNGRMRDLDPGTGPGTSRTATDVNALDEAIVESAGGEFGEVRTFLWRRGTATELPSLSRSENNGARQISNRGWVVGSSVTEGGEVRPVLWR